MWFSIIAGVALKSTVVLGAASMVAFLLRGRSAAARHLVWTAASAAVLALPFLSVWLPGLPVRAGGALLPNVRAGQIRGLAVSTAERFPTAPEFPTVAESGLPGFDVSSWYAFFVPVKTPPEIVRKMNADTVAILAEPAVKARLEQLGVSVIGSTPAAAAAKLRAETELWGPVIKAAGIKGEE